MEFQAKSSINQENNFIKLTQQIDKSNQLSLETKTYTNNLHHSLKSLQYDFKRIETQTQTLREQSSATNVTLEKQSADLSKLSLLSSRLEKTELSLARL